MIRYEIKHDNVGPYFVYLDHFIVRPFKPNTQLIAMDKVMVEAKDENDPFIFVLQVQTGIKEWWFNSGFKDSGINKEHVDWLRDRYRNQYLRLRN